MGSIEATADSRGDNTSERSGTTVGEFQCADVHTQPTAVHNRRCDISLRFKLTGDALQL